MPNKYSKTHYQRNQNFNKPKKEPIENIVRKGENAGAHHFSFSHNVFYPFQSKQLCNNKFLCLQMLLIWTNLSFFLDNKEVKILHYQCCLKLSYDDKWYLIKKPSFR